MPPYLPDVPVGLLIGSNCVKALQPIKVIPSSGDGPFAVKYRHGWTINGPLRMQKSDNGIPEVTCCNRIIVQEVKVNEIITTNDMLRLFDADFGDLNTNEIIGKLGSSQEDNIFNEGRIWDLARKWPLCTIVALQRIKRNNALQL
jgi:hypothetical protein